MRSQLYFLNAIRGRARLFNTCTGVYGSRVQFPTSIQIPTAVHHVCPKADLAGAGHEIFGPGQNLVRPDKIYLVRPLHKRSYAKRMRLEV